MENKQKKSLIKINFDFRKYAMFIALVVIAIFFQISTDGVLLKPTNVSKLIMQNSYILILAIGMLPCILTGNIDLAVGSILGMVSAIAGTLIVTKGFSVPTTILICLIIGVLVGAWQGFWIAYIRVPAFIVTLAGMLIFKGITMVILNGNTLAPFPDSYQYLASGFIPDIAKIGVFSLSTIIIATILILFIVFNEVNNRKQDLKYKLVTTSFNKFLFKILLEVVIVLFSLYWLSLYKGVPFVLVILTVLVFIYTFITQRTTLGRSIYAFGGNERATKLSGINTNKIFFLVYVNMGVLAALAGIVFSARLNAAAPSAGANLELDAIASCYIGGASASGGVGTIIGAIIGGLVMGVLNNGMSIMGIGIDWQQAIKGLVLLIAVAFDIISRRKKG